jgi:basic membrane protein A and related proteins
LPGSLTTTQAGHRVRYRRQVRQILQRSRNGAEKFKAETGTAYGEFEIANEAQREQAIRNFAATRAIRRSSRFRLRQASALEKVAKEFPN